MASPALLPRMRVFRQIQAAQRFNRQLATLTKSAPGDVVRLAAGDRILLRRTFTESDAATFAHLTGDTNPLHANTPAAQQSTYGQPLVPGMLTAALFSAAFGSTLPGSVYVGQEVKFVKPLMFGQEVEAAITVNTVTPRRSRRKDSSQVADGSKAAFESQAEDKQPVAGEEPFAAMVECTTEVSRVEDGVLLIKGSASVIVPRCQLR